MRDEKKHENRGKNFANGHGKRILQTEKTRKKLRTVKLAIPKPNRNIKWATGSVFYLKVTIYCASKC